MKASTLLALAVLGLALLAGPAQARTLKAPSTPWAARALKQVGDALTRYGSNQFIDDGSRSYGTMYSAIVRGRGRAARACARVRGG